MLEVSGAGAAESDDETELSLELSIGGSYGKCEKQRAENERVAVTGAAEQVGGESSGAADLCRRREIQAMRRLEAKRKREEKMRRLEEQQLEEMARCRKMREDKEFLEDKSGRSTESAAAKITNYVNYGNEQKQCGRVKNGYLQAYAAVPASFRPYVHKGGVDKNVAHNSGNHSRNNVDPKVACGNGSLERSSSAISDYRRTSGKDGSTSDPGSHSSCFRIAPKDTLNQPEARSTMDVPKDMIVLKEAHCNADGKPASSKPDPGADASTSKPENPVSSPPKQQNAEEPPKVGGMPPALRQMPCVTTTGNGPNRKTITGFLYRYTNAAEVRIICVCHGASFSPAEFVEHAGGTDISNPLRNITVVPSSLG